MEQDYDWIVSVIKSCKNKFHLACADKLIELFIEKHPTEKQKETDLQMERSERTIFLSNDF